MKQGITDSEASAFWLRKRPATLLHDQSHAMPRLRKAAFKLLQAAVVIGTLAGCTAEPEDTSSMMGEAWIKTDDRKCQQMMRVLPLNHIQIMQNCMGSNIGLMEDANTEMDNMRCRKMMKNISPPHMKLMRACMGPNMRMMGGPAMRAATASAIAESEY